MSLLVLIRENVAPICPVLFHLNYKSLHSLEFSKGVKHAHWWLWLTPRGWIHSHFPPAVPGSVCSKASATSSPTAPEEDEQSRFGTSDQDQPEVQELPEKPTVTKQVCGQARQQVTDLGKAHLQPHTWVWTWLSSTDRQPPERPSLTAPSTALQRCQQPGRDRGAFAHCSGPDSSSFQWLVPLTWVLWYSLKQLRTLIYASKFIYQRINDYLIMFVWMISSHYIPLQCELGASMTAM